MATYRYVVAQKDGTVVVRRAQPGNHGRIIAEFRQAGYSTRTIETHRKPSGPVTTPSDIYR